MIRSFLAALACAFWLLDAPPLRAQFVLNGSASVLPDGCIQLTPDLTNQSGSAWYPDRINLRRDFRIEADFNLGNKDANGADGIAFVLQPISTAVGGAGSSMGYGGVAPSVVVEFDTYQNGDLSDPACDHVAILSQGNPSHTASTALTTPVNILDGLCNAETGADYALSLRWTAADERLEVFVDCDLRASYTGDVLDDIFGGDSLVFFGFTSGTGAFSNNQVVCFRRLDLALPPFSASLCPGESVEINAPPGFSGYSWSPAAGLADPSAASTLASPLSSTTYFVTYTDACGESYTDSAVITVNALPELPYLPADTLVCFTDEALVLGGPPVPGQVYTWNTGAFGSVLTITESGTYTLYVSRAGCEDSVRSAVTIQGPPSLVLDESTRLWCPGDEFFYNVLSNGDSLRWSTGATTPLFVVSAPGSYSVTAWLNGCEREGGFDVVEDLNCGCAPVYPNAFSPNGDGLNDQFRLVNASGCPPAERFLLRIYNRWGELVFESGDPQVGWDGTFRGVQAELGAYIYSAVLQLPEEELRQFTGSLTLVR